MAMATCGVQDMEVSIRREKVSIRVSGVHYKQTGVTTCRGQVVHKHRCPDEDACPSKYMADVQAERYLPQTYLGCPQDC
jgi:hypothetical protein